MVDWNNFSCTKELYSVPAGQDFGGLVKRYQETQSIKEFKDGLKQMGGELVQWKWWEMC